MKMRNVQREGVHQDESLTLRAGTSHGSRLDTSLDDIYPAENLNEDLKL